jgi:hypothetical protein
MKKINGREIIETTDQSEFLSAGPSFNEACEKFLVSRGLATNEFNQRQVKKRSSFSTFKPFNLSTKAQP